MEWKGGRWGRRLAAFQSSSSFRHSHRHRLILHMGLMCVAYPAAVWDSWNFTPTVCQAAKMVELTSLSFVLSLTECAQMWLSWWEPVCMSFSANLQLLRCSSLWSALQRSCDFSWQKFLALYGPSILDVYRNCCRNIVTRCYFSPAVFVYVRVKEWLKYICMYVCT